jgi:hypothetical protein
MQRPVRVLVRASVTRVRARHGTDAIGCRIAVTSEVLGGMASGAARLLAGLSLFSARWAPLVRGQD